MTTPMWFEMFAGIYVVASIVSALLVAGDIFLGGRRHPMAVMDFVWPLTLLYWGPVGLIFYGWFGRAAVISTDPHAMHMKADVPMWQATFKGAAHCGAGCALGDFAGDWLAFGTGFAVAGSPFAGKLIVSFVLAYLLGIVFQYFSIAPMKHLGLSEGLIAALKIDTLSIVAYEIGMFIWMGLREAVYPDLPPTDWAYWFMMQIAMVLGFATTWPVNAWLIHRGIKEKM